MALKFKVKNNSAVHKLKVSKYENHSIALELIAKICSTQNNDNIHKEVWNKLIEKFDEFKEIYDTPEHHEVGAFIDELGYLLKDFGEVATQNENFDYTPVVVAGGFSAGKSSMINKITNIGNLLPTDVEPVSVIETHIYCTDKEDSLTIKGENLKKELVDLEPDVLESIQHSSKSKVYIASVLEKIQIETTAPKTKGIVFIDTPGYNNSNTANKESGRTDEDTAKQALKKGKVLFWLIDIEAGTITKADLEFLNSFKGDKVIIFNKADKKTESEIQKIINLASNTINSKSRNDVLDIVAFSSTKDYYYSYENISFEELIEKIRNNNTDSHKGFIEKLRDLFEKQIKYVSAEKEKHTEKLGSLRQERIDWNKTVNNYKKYEKDGVKDLKEVFNSYNMLFSKLTTFMNISSNTIEELRNSLSREDNKTFSSAPEIAWKKFNKLVNNYNKSINFESYGESFLNSVLNNISTDLKELTKTQEGVLKFINEEIDSLTNYVITSKKETEILEKEKENFTNLIEHILQEIRKKKSTKETVKKEMVSYTIFETIQHENMIAFYECLSRGVDMEKCNEQGYNPLTFAIKHGNNEIVKFFIDKKVDLTLKDENGYNALETAVLYQFKDIFDLIIKNSTDLSINKQQLIELSKQNENRFTNWLKNTKL